MSAWQTPAIVLTVKDFGEADRLVTFLTPARGRLTGLAKHAKKSRKRFANVLEPLKRVEFFSKPLPPAHELTRADLDTTLLPAKTER